MKDLVSRRKEGKSVWPWAVQPGDSSSSTQWHPDPWHSQERISVQQGEEKKLSLFFKQKDKAGLKRLRCQHWLRKLAKYPSNVNQCDGGGAWSYLIPGLSLDGRKVVRAGVLEFIQRPLSWKRRLRRYIVQLAGWKGGLGEEKHRLLFNNLF